MLTKRALFIPVAALSAACLWKIAPSSTDAAQVVAQQSVGQNVEAPASLEQQLAAMPAGAAASTFDPASLKNDGLSRIAAPKFDLAADGTLRFSISDGSETFNIVARPNMALFAPDARVVRSGVSMSLKEAGLEIPLHGTIEGRPKSWVRVSRKGTNYQGLIFSGDSLYDLRAQEGSTDQLRFGKVEFSQFLDNPTGEHFACASGDLSRFANPKHAPEPAACTSIDMVIVGDYAHVNALGGEAGSESEMANRMNEIDGIYRDDLDHALRVKEIVTLPNQGTPAWNVPNPSGEQYPETPLYGFSDWKGANYPSLGLIHLFTARTQSGVVGLAWVGTTCQSSQGAGVSNYLGQGRSSTIVAAHEIGHNFGSDHDSGSQGFIMHPSVIANATQFSPASKSMIAGSIGNCFVPCDQTDDETTSDETTSDETTSEETTSEETTSEETTSEDTTSEETSTDVTSEESTEDTGGDSTATDSGGDSNTDSVGDSNATGDGSEGSDATGDGSGDDASASDDASGSDGDGADSGSSSGGCSVDGKTSRGAAWMFGLLATGMAWRRRRSRRA